MNAPPDLDGAWTPIAQDIASTGDTTSVTDPTPPAGDAFYRIVRRPPPPLYFAGFEAGEDLTGWTEIVDNGSTQWEVGPPTSGPGSANSGDNVYATKLGADYDNDLTVFLQSPEIDITGRENVTVQFFQWFDFEYLAVEDLETDWGEVTVVDDTGFPLLTAPIRAARSSGGWVQATLVLPDGLADKIRIECRVPSSPMPSANVPVGLSTTSRCVNKRSIVSVRATHDVISTVAGGLSYPWCHVPPTIHRKGTQGVACQV